MNDDKTSAAMYKKTFCGYALEKAFDQFQTNETSASLSSDLKEAFFQEFYRAMMETFQHVQTTTHMKGAGSYRSIDGNMWEFLIKKPEIKTDSDNLQPELLQIYSAIHPDSKKKKKGKK
ncbi:hypothetical protein EIN_424260 [Entamoeba invadens IP1]|uniref:Transcription initiation factor IIA subunit 2 n=1 Tax=Entamoeba invadens IP1 TaxID=370355 RepID=A0A0A1UBR6_ENTIV|nr:hypothetical protein EIN_424260 [Entamoeba invadens IP1]ELP89744.1 hypothetical protein EIN_424260 [Entamoeba invadens IP1]|eukprot:XP_004256515.1 hypothetical protein EIN_424260 [Entamoeba invadens IP1]